MAEDPQRREARREGRGNGPRRLILEKPPRSPALRSYLFSFLTFIQLSLAVRAA